MKQVLYILAFCMTLVASCVKEQAIPKSLSSQNELKAMYLDDFYISKNLKPLFHRIDTGTSIIIFSDSVYNNFGGSLKQIGFRFSNPNIAYRNFKLTVSSTSGAQYSSYSAATTTMNNGVKELMFDKITNGILLSAGWSKIVLKAKVFGNPGDSFHVTIPAGYITYHSINDQPGVVVGLPLSTEGLKIRQ